MTRPPSPGPPSPGASSAGPGLLARAALALYPPSWRVRYGDEVRALLEDSGGGLAAVASLAWRALPAWFWPPRHLHDRPARMRASLGTALMFWSMLTGLGLVFAQLTQFQGLDVPGHPEVRWAYAVFDVTLAVSVLVAGLGGLPLWLLMLRRAWRERRRRDTVYLLLPVIAPVTYLAALVVTVRQVGGTNGISPWWFGVVTLAGFAAAMAVAATAIVVAVVGLCLWARSFAGYHHGTVPGIYLALVVAAATVTTASAARGARAALHTGA